MNRRSALVKAASAAVSAYAVARTARADTLTIPGRTAHTASDVDDVKAMIEQSAKEWSAGDIDAFCAHYHDDAVFLSPSGKTVGRASVLERYKKKYGADKASTGTLTLEIVDAFASSTAASVAMRWHLAWANKPAAEGWSVIGLVRASSTAPWLIKHDASM